MHSSEKRDRERDRERNRERGREKKKRSSIETASGKTAQTGIKNRRRKAALGTSRKNKATHHETFRDTEMGFRGRRHRKNGRERERERE